MTKARAGFDAELEQLKLELIQMGGQVEDAISRSIAALEESDRDEAKQIIESDASIDQMEKAIESRCLRLLMRQQPVARDLRRISTALKIITDLERIGDHASDISELTIRLAGSAPEAMAKHIPQMSGIAIEMVRDCVQAFIDSDLDKARRIIARDDAVDELFGVVRGELVRTLAGEGGKETADRAIDVMMVAKYLERIGDHAVNIAEWVVFFDTGVHKETPIL